MKKKGLIIYILTHESKIIGGWSNPKHLLEGIDEYNTALYYRIHRSIKKQQGEFVEMPICIFSGKDGKEYTIHLVTVK